jgi:cobalamin biosynthesis Mg chelatase CobN
MYRGWGEEQSRQPGWRLPAVMSPPTRRPHGPGGEAMQNRANPCKFSPDGFPVACRLTIKAARGVRTRATGKRAQLAAASAAAARKATAAAEDGKQEDVATETRAAGVASGNTKSQVSVCVHRAARRGRKQWGSGKQVAAGGGAAACRPRGICCARRSLRGHGRERSPQVLPLVAQLLVALLQVCLPRPLRRHQRLQGLDAVGCRALLVLMQRPAGGRQAGRQAGRGEGQGQTSVG